jgi:uncharacterized protein
MEKSSRQILYETLIVLALTLIPGLIWPSLKGLLTFLPVVYLLVEKGVRRRPWAALGFQRQNFRQALSANALLIVLVAVVIQVGVAAGAAAFWPALLAHIQSRLPLFDPAHLAPFFIIMLLGVLVEEMTYRALFQERLSWFIPTPLAIGLIAVVFGLLHIAPGDPAIVAADVILVILDGAIYGLIFARGRNIWVAFLAHLLADVVGLAALLVV